MIFVGKFILKTYGVAGIRIQIAEKIRKILTYKELTF
jgi:hypothetical protein